MVNGHGGDRQPRNPAPTSGPGAASRRTDGGPGSARQPIRRIPGQPFGQGQALMQQQSAAPMQANGTRGPADTAAGPGGLEATLREGVFGPSRRPNEPATAGAPMGPGAGADQPVLDEDPDMMLRALYANFPHPDIEALLVRRNRGR